MCWRGFRKDSFWAGSCCAVGEAVAAEVGLESRSSLQKEEQHLSMPTCHSPVANYCADGGNAGSEGDGWLQQQGGPTLARGAARVFASPTLS